MPKFYSGLPLEPQKPRTFNAVVDDFREAVERKKQRKKPYSERNKVPRHTVEEIEAARRVNARIMGENPDE